MQYADNEFKWICVLNRKVPVHMLLNAVAHLMLAMQSKCCEEAARRLHQYTEPGGTAYAELSHWPVIILEARNSNQLRTLRAAALAAGLPVQAFVHTMYGSSAEQQIRSTATTEESNQEYVAVLMFAKTEELAMTRKFSLFSSRGDLSSSAYHTLAPH